MFLHSIYDLKRMSDPEFTEVSRKGRESHCYRNIEKKKAAALSRR